MEKVYTTKQAAARLGCHHLTLLEWEKKGLIPPADRYRHTEGRMVKVDADDVRHEDWRGYTEDDITAIFERRADPTPAPSVPRRPSNYGNGHLSARHVGALLNCDRTQIARLRRQGRMPPSRTIGTGHVWSQEAIDNFVRWTTHPLYSANRLVRWELAERLMENYEKAAAKTSALVA